MPRLNVTALKGLIGFGEIDQAAADLGVVFGLLGIKKTGGPTFVEVDESRCATIHSWILEALPTATLLKYKDALNLILRTIEWGTIRSIEVKEGWYRVEFPCPAWCRTRANATESQIAAAGGLTTAYSTEMCYSVDRSWTPMRFIFSYIEKHMVLPLKEDDEAGKVSGALEQFGENAYYFLVPQGTGAYSQGAKLTSEVAFPVFVPADDIWFAGKSQEKPHRVSWKRDKVASNLPQPAATAADDRLRSLFYTTPLRMVE